MKRITRYALLMLFAGALFATSCKKDDDPIVTPDPQSTDELVLKYNNPSHSVDTNIALAWHRCLDESDPTIAFLPVADKEEAFATFLAWLGSPYNKNVNLDHNGTFSYPCNDTNLQPLGNLTFSYSSSDNRAVAEIVLPEKGGCQFTKARFILFENWPENAQYPGYSDFNIIINNQRILFRVSPQNVSLSQYLLESALGSNSFSYSLKSSPYVELPTAKELEALLKCSKLMAPTFSSICQIDKYEYTYDDGTMGESISLDPYNGKKVAVKQVMCYSIINTTTYNFTFTGTNTGDNLSLPIGCFQDRTNYKRVIQGTPRGTTSQPGEKSTTYFNYLAQSGSNALAQFSFPVTLPQGNGEKPIWSSKINFQPFTLNRSTQQIPNFQENGYVHLYVMRVAK